jgi:tetratricopeptide (TPR) repeat protein
VATRKDTAHDVELVQELNSIFDHISEWVGGHPREVLISIALVLISAAAVGFGLEWRKRGAEAAEAAVSQAWGDYEKAMGARPGEEVVEPANPEVGKKARTESAAKLLAAAQEHNHSAAAVNARLLAAALLEANGDAKAAFEARKLAAAEAPARSGVKALAETRYAVALEASGDVKGAAGAFERAAAIDVPGQVLALADAARCYLALGDTQRAGELYARAQKLDIDAVPAYIREPLNVLVPPAPLATKLQ